MSQIDVTPTLATQILRGHDGRIYEVSGEAGRVAKMLADLDPPLHTRFAEGPMAFVVSQRTADGTEHLVGRVPMDQWNERVVRDFEQRAYEVRNGISAAARLDALDAKAKADRDYETDQMLRERAAPLFRAIQRETLGSNPRIYIRSHYR
jgi:hypothetical protein